MITTHPDITEVRPLGEDDAACLLALWEVLDQHDALGRFGINLLHSHFEMDESEVLLEVCDPETRTLVTRPGKPEEDLGHFVGTAFEWLTEPVCGSGQPIVALKCKVGCFVDLKDRHKRTHDRVW